MSCCYAVLKCVKSHFLSLHMSGLWLHGFTQSAIADLLLKALTDEALAVDVSTTPARQANCRDVITPTNHDADAFLSYFDEKVRTVRTATDGRLPPAFTPATAESLSVLSPCSTDEVRQLIMQSPTKSCAIDPIPTFLLKELVDPLLPYVTAMINASCARDTCRQNRSALSSLRC